MFKHVCGALVCLLVGLTPVMGATPAPATAEFAEPPAGAPTRDEVMQQVTKAVEFFKANGREKTLAEMNKRDGLFAKGMDYVDVHDLNGVCVAHPVSPDVVGQNRLEVKDMHGKQFIKEIVDAAKSQQQQDGWVSYMREN